MAEGLGRRREGSLADRLGLDPDRAMDRLGRFTPLELDDLGCSWWQSGSPIQVLVGVDRSGGVCVAMPTTTGSGPTPVLSATDVCEVAVDDSDWVAELADVVERYARRRRASFRYCRICRTITPPENRSAFRDVCDGCAPALGVVF